MLRGSQHIFVPGMQEWSPVTPESMAEVALGLRRRFFGADARPVLLLPRITLGLAFLRARFYFSLLPLFHVLRELFVSFTPVFRSRRSCPRRVHDQSFAEP